ncbi:Hsp20/alpha crystallin family protein [Bacillus sp. 1P06AnD]|uniref:Hsp20/alpha crystallin family protein n=1 Tax=Bacillus sp. 1P06AnD TaxID=3132208 RepID=UPI0039A20FC0
MNGQLYSLTHFESWVQQNGENPFASYLDDSMFPVYCYEYEDRYCVEAFLPDIKADELRVSIKDSILIIASLNNGQLERRIVLPTDSLPDFSMVHEPSFLTVIIEKTANAG